MLLALQLNNLLEDAGANPPTLLGTVPNMLERQNSGTHQLDVGNYFSGADTYAIAPSVEAGWSFDTNTGVLEIDTDALGTFGPFTVTATNVNGDTDSNLFYVVVAEAAQGGHFAPKRRKPAVSKDERKEDREELRRIIDAASGLLQIAKEQAEEKAITSPTQTATPSEPVQQIRSLASDLQDLRQDFAAHRLEFEAAKREAMRIMQSAAMQEAVTRLVAKVLLNLIEDITQEISAESKAWREK